MSKKKGRVICLTDFYLDPSTCGCLSGSMCIRQKYCSNKIKAVVIDRYSSKTFKTKITFCSLAIDKFKTN